VVVGGHDTATIINGMRELKRQNLPSLLKEWQFFFAGEIVFASRLALIHSIFSEHKTGEQPGSTVGTSLLAKRPERPP
jgi:hypothetical protein